MDIKKQIIDEIDIQMGRREDRINLSDIAQGCQLSPASVSRWYHGHNSMKLSNIQKVCDFLGIKFVKIKE